MTYSLSQALAELLAQHDEIRRMMHRCELLADELDASKIEPGDLLREVARLRVAFDVHNKFEEQLLRPILRDADAFGEVRVDRMIDDHVGEHRAMRVGLGSAVTTELRATLQKLRDHLAAEERYFLSPKVMRDDLVTVEGGG
jgi:hemerythrin HHE cation binding domain-containing protein